jgi:putative heme iron utilization protein
MGQTSPHAATPLAAVGDAPRRSPAEEARTLVAAADVATLSTLTAEGEPWGSLVSFAAMADGAPVLCVSRLAEHARNLLGDARASLLVSARVARGEDPLSAGRVTLAGRARQPAGEDATAARTALLAAHPSAARYVDWEDFTLWVLAVQRVRWVGGYARMDSVDGADYARAEPDPVAPQAAHGVRHLNDDHADALLQMVRALGGHPDASAASCTGADRYGIDLEAVTPRGPAATRIAFRPVIDAPDGLRRATVDLAMRARAALGPGMG